jgi:hypothetical protein
MPDPEVKEVEEVEEEVEEVEEEEEEEAGEEKEEEEDLDEDSLKEAKLLYKALADPKQSHEIIRSLAKKVGLLDDKSPPTQKEAREGKKQILDIVKEELGEAYSGILGEKLSRIFEKVLTQEREDQQAVHAQTQAELVNNQVEQVYDKLDKETKGEAKKFRASMEKLALEVQPAEGVSIEKYMRNLYTLATAGSTTKKVKTNLADKINRNANDIHSRVGSKGSSGQGKSRSESKENRSLKDIVNETYENLANSKD